MTNKIPEAKDVTVDANDDTDADAFAILGVLVIAATALVFYLTH